MTTNNDPSSQFHSDEYWSSVPQSYAFDITLAREDGEPISSITLRSVLRRAVLALPRYFEASVAEVDFMDSLAFSAKYIQHDGPGIRVQMQISLVPGSREQHRRFVGFMQAKGRNAIYLDRDGHLRASGVRSGVIEFVEHQRALSAGQSWDAFERNRAWISLSALSRLRDGSNLDEGASEGEIFRQKVSWALASTATEIGLWKGGAATSKAAEAMYAEILLPRNLFAHYALGVAQGWPAHESFMEVAALLEDPTLGLDLEGLRARVAACVEDARGECGDLARMDSLVADWMRSASPDQCLRMNFLARCAFGEADKVSPQHVRIGALAPWDLFGFSPGFDDLVAEAKEVIAAYDEGILTEDALQALDSTEGEWRRLMGPSAETSLSKACRHIATAGREEGVTVVDIAEIRAGLQASTGDDYPPKVETVMAAIRDLAGDAQADWPRAVEVLDALQATLQAVEAGLQGDSDDGLGEDLARGWPVFGPAVHRVIDQAEALRDVMARGAAEGGLFEVGAAWLELVGMVQAGKWDEAAEWQPYPMTRVDRPAP